MIRRLIFNGLIFRRVSFLFFLLAALPIIFYIFLVAYFSVNIPVWDDYDTVLAYLNKPAPIRYQILFSQHNEHRIAWNRLVVEGYYCIFGNVNFRYLAFLGNLGLLLIALLMFNLFKSQRVKIALFIPVFYFIFQPQAWENITWATGSLQNHYVILFALLAFYLWNKRTYPGYVSAIFFGLLAAYTSANGLLVLLMIFLWELAVITIHRHNSNGFLDNRRLRLFVFLIGLAMFFLYFFYFKDYRSARHHPSILQALLDPALFIQYILMFIGSYMGLNNKSLAFLFGLTQLVLFFYVTYLKYYQKNPVNYFFSAFILLTILMIALGRAGFGIDQAFSSRYKIFSILFFVSIYCAVVEIWPSLFLKKSIIFALILFSILFNIGSQTLDIKNLAERRNTLEEIKEWRYTGKGLNYPNQERANLIIKDSIEKGIYMPPSMIENKS